MALGILLSEGNFLILLVFLWHVVISENLCSLIGGKDRLAVSVVWTVDPDNDFEVLDVWFGRTIIQSRHQVEHFDAIADF